MCVCVCENTFLQFISTVSKFPNSQCVCVCVCVCVYTHIRCIVPTKRNRLEITPNNLSQFEQVKPSS